jgi:hypothetical protein
MAQALTRQPMSTAAEQALLGKPALAGPFLARAVDAQQLASAGRADNGGGAALLRVTKIQLVEICHAAGHFGSHTLKYCRTHQPRVFLREPR